MSICNRPNNCTYLFALSLVQRVINPRFAVAVSQDMCAYRLCAVGHESLEIGAIMVMLARLRYGDAIESDVILTE